MRNGWLEDDLWGDDNWHAIPEPARVWVEGVRQRLKETGRKSSNDAVENFLHRDVQSITLSHEPRLKRKPKLDGGHFIVSTTDGYGTACYCLYIDIYTGDVEVSDEFEAKLLIRTPHGEVWSKVRRICVTQGDGSHRIITVRCGESYTRENAFGRKMNEMRARMAAAGASPEVVEHTVEGIVLMLREEPQMLALLNEAAEIFRLENGNEQA